MSYCALVNALPADTLDPNKHYHDHQYGFPLVDDNALFGRLLLEINQAGLSWTLMLKKQAAFHAAYSGFNIAAIAAYGDADRTRINPGRVLWMSPKRKRLDWQTATSPGFYLHPQPDYQALKLRLAAPPTTGAMLIDLLARSAMTRLDLYGFDFFASQSLSGRRTADQVPHDFDAEAAWADALIHADPRLHLNRG